MSSAGRKSLSEDSSSSTLIWTEARVGILLQVATEEGLKNKTRIRSDPDKYLNIAAALERHAAFNGVPVTAASAKKKFEGMWSPMYKKHVGGNAAAALTVSLPNLEALVTSLPDGNARILAALMYAHCSEKQGAERNVTVDHHDEVPMMISDAAINHEGKLGHGGLASSTLNRSSSAESYSGSSSGRVVSGPTNQPTATPTDLAKPRHGKDANARRSKTAPSRLEHADCWENKEKLWAELEKRIRKDSLTDLHTHLCGLGDANFWVTKIICTLLPRLAPEARFSLEAVMICTGFRFAELDEDDKFTYYSELSKFESRFFDGFEGTNINFMGCFTVDGSATLTTSDPLQLRRRSIEVTQLVKMLRLERARCGKDGGPLHALVSNWFEFLNFAGSAAAQADILQACKYIANRIIFSDVDYVI
jgi:hypothetical protein